MMSSQTTTSTSMSMTSMLLNNVKSTTTTMLCAAVTATAAVAAVVACACVAHSVIVVAVCVVASTVATSVVVILAIRNVLQHHHAHIQSLRKESKRTTSLTSHLVHTPLTTSTLVSQTRVDTRRVRYSRRDATLRRIASPTRSYNQTTTYVSKSFDTLPLLPKRQPLPLPGQTNHTASASPSPSPPPQRTPPPPPPLVSLYAPRPQRGVRHPLLVLGPSPIRFPRSISTTYSITKDIDLVMSNNHPRSNGILRASAPPMSELTSNTTTELTTTTSIMHDTTLAVAAEKDNAP